MDESRLYMQEVGEGDGLCKQERVCWHEVLISSVKDIVFQACLSL